MANSATTPVFDLSRRPERTSVGRLLPAVVILAISALVQASSAAGQDLPVDSVAVTIRAEPSAELAAFRENPRFDYSRDKPEAASPISDLLSRRWREFMQALFGSGLARPLLWLFAIAVVIFVVSMLIGSDTRSVFYRKERPLPITLEEAVLSETDFTERILQAVSTGQYREAVRLRFLRALKGLERSGAIRWTIEKTNRTYVRELRRFDAADSLLQPFELIVNWFDFCWYGHARVDKEMYQQVDEAFSTFEGLLRSVRVREEAIA